jgi:hypothetical protein
LHVIPGIAGRDVSIETDNKEPRHIQAAGESNLRKRKSDSQIKLVFVSVVLVTSVWLIVLVYLGRSLLLRLTE